jgi:hypothetical protein
MELVQAFEGETGFSWLIRIVVGTYSERVFPFGLTFL